MKKMGYVFLVLFTSILFIGCSGKTPTMKPTQESLKERALVIGSLSRNSGRVFYRELGFSVFKDKKYLRTIFHKGKDISFKSLSVPFEFEDEFKYEDSAGSIFAFYLEPGSYSLAQFYTGSGGSYHKGNYSIDIIVKSGEIIYLGDFKFEPFATRDDNIFKNVIPVGAKLIVSNAMMRDKLVFEKKFKKQVEAKENVTPGEFNLNGFSAAPQMIFIPLVYWE